jgi:Uma2 family endonuclease
MNLAVRKPMTLAEFLEWEERQPLRYEFDGVGPVAMTGGTRAHARVQRNLAICIGGRLRGKPCEFLGSDLKIKTSEDHVRYPDGFVTCSPGDNASTPVSDPVVIFEVLSSSTAANDRIVKAREYQAMPSVQRYVMLEQDGVSATVYVRTGDTWTHEILIADSMLSLPEVGVSLPLAELYEGIVFETEQDANRTADGEPADL